MDKTLQSSQSPVDKAKIDGGIVNTSPTTSTYHEMQVATPATSSVSIQSSLEKGKTSGKTFTTPPETPFFGNMESNAGQPAPSLSATSSPTSSLNTPVLPSSLDIFASQAAEAPYAAGPRPGTYTHQFLTSSIRTPIVRNCERCVTGCRFKTFSQSVCDGCIRSGHGSEKDMMIYYIRVMQEDDELLSSARVNATTRNQAIGNAAIGDDDEDTTGYDSDATVSVASDY
ncbi:uncharacterized protein EAF02_009535 [Botrytis sinoallii]|uniref:uncharacterized protein n=1 Tax=Botrytis sinoallii TaxID=1463999 RepID=UPI001902074D|nr:uncharacterized protein EAF02_009535 [Botrytis sinoallii]KAF7868799.1 hypothetical protein EAF02_009535 [Botrytis sinoallii]